MSASNGFPKGSKRAAAFLLLIACWGIYTIGGTSHDTPLDAHRGVVSSYVLALTEGRWAQALGASVNGSLDFVGISALGPTKRPASQAPGFAHAHPAPKENPQNVIMTMIAGNSAARHAVAMIQSLRDVNTKADAIIVMLQQGGVGSPECHNDTYRALQGRSGAGRGACSGPESLAEDIVSPFYLSIMKRLGAVFMVTPELPRTPWTQDISGGTQVFWGMSLNKMQIFNMTQFKKIIFLDADTLIFKNIDHLFGPEYPMFTAAMTFDCCNKNGPPMLSGGFWIVEPDISWGIRAWELMVQGMPDKYSNGTQKQNPDGSLKYTTWRLSDLDLARAMFAATPADDDNPLWPGMLDLRHGYVPGLRLLPAYRNMSDAEFSRASRNQRQNKVVLKEGFQTDLWDGKSAVWRALDIRYDQCVGMCECLPEYDLREEYISIHFSCIQGDLRKPGVYTTEHAFMLEMYTKATGCTRYYYIERWYATLVRAGARLDPPYWEGTPVPIWNDTHDGIVRAHIKDLKKQGRW